MTRPDPPRAYLQNCPPASLTLSHSPSRRRNPHSDHPSLRSPLTPQACSVIIQSQSPHSKKKYKPRSHRQLPRTAATLPQPRSIFSCNPRCCTCTVSRRRNPPGILDLACSHQESSIFGAGRGNTGGVAVRERGNVSRPDHRGGAGSDIESSCSGRDRVTHYPVPIRPVAIPILETKMKKSHGTQSYRCHLYK